MSEVERLETAAEWYLTKQLDFDRRLIEYRYRTIRPYFKGSRCLELGSAEGEMTRRLVGDFEAVTLVEGSSTLLAETPDRSNLRKVCALFEEFDTDETFDTVIMEHILEHVLEPRRILERVLRWTTSGSRILVGVPNGRSIHRLAAVKMGLLEHPCELNDRDRDLGHRRVYTAETLRHDIESAGLSLVRLDGVFLKPLSNQQIQSGWTGAMVDAFYELGKEFPEHAAELCAVCEAP